MSDRLSLGSFKSQTPTQTNGRSRKLRGVRSYRGRKLEDLIPQIRAELGPDAIILRQREGLTGGVAGFFAQKCVEVDAQAAQPRVDTHGEPEVDERLLAENEDPYAQSAADDLQATDDLPGQFDEAPTTEQPTRYGRHAAEIPVVPQQAAPPAEPSFFERLQEAAGLIADGPTPAAPRPAPAMVEAAQVAAESEPQPEPVAIPQPATAAANALAPQRIVRLNPTITKHAPAPVAERAPAPAQVLAQRTFAAQQPGLLNADDAAALADELTAQGVSENWARQLIDKAAAHLSPLVLGNLRDAVRATLASILPSPASLPAGGAAIAFVGAGGSGKTCCTASLAAAYARASTLAASVVALGGEDWGANVRDLLKGRSTWVTVAPTAHVANAAVQSGRQHGMVVVDTPATSPRDEAAVEALAAELSALALDAVYITVPATFSVHAAKRLVESFAPLRPNGIAVTHADEAEQLGVTAELAHISGVPIAYVHDGLELDSALAASDPTSLAARLLP